MKILSAQQIKKADAFTIKEEPISSIHLMERAATKCTEWITKNFSQKNTFHILCGPGNNGGDGLAIARQMREKNFSVYVYIIQCSDSFSKDFLYNLDRIKSLNIKCKEINTKNYKQFFKIISTDNIFIDAIFGAGLNRPLSGWLTQIVQSLNNHPNTLISIDIPSGLFCENFENITFKNTDIIQADYTLTFQAPKLSFLLPEFGESIGIFIVLDIGLDQHFISNLESPYYYVEHQEIQSLLKKRRKYSHKGSYGHALILAGSYGKMGAAIIAAKACLRSGAGLLTMQVPLCGYDFIQSSIPESMVITDSAPKYLSAYLSKDLYNAVGLGPGIGLEKETQGLIKKIIQTSNKPLVIDADALNILANYLTETTYIPENSILTPHPKEFERLVGKAKNDFHRLSLLQQLAQTHKIYVILKGAHSAIATPNGEIFFNSSGNPGMSKGGSGDALTGILTGLLAQGYTSFETCILGTYIHGLAADIAAKSIGQEALIASDIVDHIGKAFLALRDYNFTNDITSHS